MKEGRRWLSIALLIGSSFAWAGSNRPALTPTFFLVAEQPSLREITATLEARGVRIRHTAPRVLIADIPPTVVPTSFPFVERAFQTPIAVAAMEPYGPLAVAAALQWNQTQLKSAQTASRPAAAALRAQVAEKSLGAPGALQLRTEGLITHGTWEPTAGALYYHAQLADDLDFSRILVESRTSRPSVRLPAIRREGRDSLFLRVRAADRPHAENPSEDLFGPWVTSAGSPAPLGLPSEGFSPPVLSSPLDDFQTEGFTVLLEWSGSSAATFRLQISRSEDFQDILIDEIVDGNEFVCPPDPLHIGDALYWRVKIWGDSSSAWSSVRRFRVGPPGHHAPDMMVNPEAPR